MLIIKLREFLESVVLRRSPKESFLWELVFISVINAYSNEVILVESNDFAPKQQLFEFRLSTIIK